MNKNKHEEIHKFSDKVAFLAPFLSIIPHVFCCGIPLSLAISSSLFGITAHQKFIKNTEYFDIYMFIFSALSLIVAYVFYFRSKECCDTHRKRKFYNKITIIIATLVFFISLFHHIFEFL